MVFEQVGFGGRILDNVLYFSDMGLWTNFRTFDGDNVLTPRRDCRFTFNIDGCSKTLGLEEAKNVLKNLGYASGCLFLIPSAVTSSILNALCFPSSFSSGLIKPLRNFFIDFLCNFSISNDVVLSVSDKGLVFDFWSVETEIVPFKVSKAEFLRLLLKYSLVTGIDFGGVERCYETSQGVAQWC